ncbi:MAG: agmatine deiminase family protein [Saprospiraceae bacterium]
MRTKTTLAFFAALFFSCGLFAQKFTTPPPTSVRAMAEWEELQALIITWNGQANILTEIVRAAREECNVIICCADQNLVTQAKNKLNTSGVDISSNVTFLVTPNNSIWVRDYGPNCVYANDVDSLHIVDWIYNRPSRPQDNLIPEKIAEHLQLPVFSTSVAPYDLVNTGGNFMTDGRGTAFASKLIFTNNDQIQNGECGIPNDVLGTSSHTESSIDNIMQEFMGIERYVKFDLLPYDCIHHIDMHIKLLDEETLLVGQYPPGIADGPQIEANLQYVLSNFQTSFGTPFKVVRVPMPPEGGQYPNAGGDYRTYANAVFVNKTILVPFYETQFDTTARRIWQEAMPGYKVVGINCNSIIPSLGAIHCITKEVGVNEPLRIVHQALQCQDNSLVFGEYSVYATVQHRSGIEGAKLFYTTDLSAPWQSTDMTQGIIPNGDWFGAIPMQAAGSTVFYYIEAKAVNGKTLARPITAPDGWWKFCVTQSSGVETPLADLLEIYPNPASATTVVPVQCAAKTRGSVLLFNSLGQLVQEIFSGEFPSGNSNYFLDAGNLASGTYFVKLQTGGQVRVRKLVVR